jgi:NADPH:quinone reductase-like Zn-dependent oxidoreductase
MLIKGLADRHPARNMHGLCIVLLLLSSALPNSSAATLNTARRTVIVTGANRGIGLAAVKALASTDQWNIVMACRSVEKAEVAKKSIANNANVEICELDLSDLKSVKKFAANWGSRPLHVLACNAGKLFTSYVVHTRVLKCFVGPQFFE